MDLLSTIWSPETEMNESTFGNQWQHMSSLENESLHIKHFPSTTTTNISTEDYNHNNNHYISQITKKPWIIDSAIETSSSNNFSSSSTIISFGNSELNTVENKKASSLSSVYHQISNLEDVYARLEHEETKRGVPTTPEQALDHVLAERKRREKMTQKFIALSTLIPGLKKIGPETLTTLDKATVLGDAINYIKELQERVKVLEVEVKGNQNEEATGFGAGKRARYISSYDNDTSSSVENIDGICINNIVFGSSGDRTSPEIEVRSSEENVMVRVYCKNQTGVIKDVMGEIEKHNLSIISSSVMPFGDNSLHMTIIAQMDAESELTSKHLADDLRTCILNLV